MTILIAILISIITEYNTLLEYCNKQSIIISRTYNQSITLIKFYISPSSSTKSINYRKYNYQIITGKFKEEDLNIISKKRKGNNNHEASSSSSN